MIKFQFTSDGTHKELRTNQIKIKYNNARIIPSQIWNKISELYPKCTTDCARVSRIWLYVTIHTCQAL